MFNATANISQLKYRMTDLKHRLTEDVRHADGLLSRIDERLSINQKLIQQWSRK